MLSFKCPGVCPSCTTRRMVETAAHLADHVIARLPLRQWVLSVPKRLRDLGLLLEPGPPQALNEFRAAERGRWSKLIKDIGLQPE